MRKHCWTPGVMLVVLFCNFMAGCVARQDAIEPVGEQEEQVAVVKTRQGKFVIGFHPNSAPVAVENFKNLVRKRFYDGLTFHRRENTEIMSIIQGGDPNGDGTGGPGYTISDEYTNPNQRPHLRGTVAMARTRAPNSAGSQFYICLNPQPLLDGSYTTFGQVIKGMNVVDKLRVGDVMKTVKLEARSEHVKSK